jgi:hypothetical protein
MEFRSEAKSIAGVAVAGLLLGITAPQVLAQVSTYEVRHRHWREGAEGTLRVSPGGISFEEHGKKGKTDSRQWQYEEIQQLTVSPTELRILTYEDSKWEFGRDREYVFDRLPKDLAAETYPLWAGKLDQRFVAAVPVQGSGVEWKSAAKLDRGMAGPVGALSIGRDWIVFDAGKRDGSRSWRLMDLENISRTGPLDFTVTTAEKAGWFRGGMRDFHFQLQQRLPEEIYNSLWREINRSQGLVFLDSQQRRER